MKITNNNPFSPFQKIVNFLFKDTGVQYNENRWEIKYSRDPNFFRFLKQINKIYAKKTPKENLSTEETLNEAAALYRLAGLFSQNRQALEKIRKRIKLLFENAPLWPSFQAPSESPLKPNQEALELTEKISTKLIYDYQIPIIELFNLFPITSEPLKLRIIKKYLVSNIDEKIHSLFWKVDFDPLIDDSVFHILEPSTYNEGLKTFLNKPFYLQKTSFLHLQGFFKELWWKDFRLSIPKIKLAKLRKICHSLDTFPTASILCLAFFYSTKNQVREWIEKHKNELQAWENWINLFLLFTKQKNDDLKSSHETNLMGIQSLQKLLIESWGTQSCLLKLLPQENLKNLNKEAINRVENRLYWLTLLGFALTVGKVSEKNIIQSLPSLEEIAFHPDLEQKNWAVSFYLCQETAPNYFLNDLCKMKIPLVPALFAMYYISSVKCSVNHLEETKKDLRQILKCYFPKTHLHDRNHQRLFCSWLGQLIQLESLPENKIRKLLKILSLTSSREELVKAMEASQVLWNLKLFKELQCCFSHSALIDFMQQLAPQKFGIKESSEFSLKFNQLINNFEQSDGLLFYYSNLKSWDEEEYQEKALKLFRNFIVCLAENTFHENRYKNNPIISYLEKNSPSTLIEWKKGADYNLREQLKEHPYFQKSPATIVKELINQGVFIQNGLQFDLFPYLYSYLHANKEEIVKNLKKTIELLKKQQTEERDPVEKKILGQKRKLRIAEKMLIESLENHEINIMKTLRHLRQIYRYLLEGKAETEANQILKVLTKYSLLKCENLVVHDSDNPRILFFSGTKMHGSCQSIYSNAMLSCALLGYLWNGHNRIIFMFDPNHEKIVIVRAIFRLMFDKSGHAVLLLEKIHYRCAQEEEEFYKFLIIKAAIKRAQELKLPLVMIREENDTCWHSGLHIENLFCPFDYSDAAVGNAFPSYDGSLKVSHDRITCIYNPEDD